MCFTNFIEKAYGQKVPVHIEIDRLYVSNLNDLTVTWYKKNPIKSLSNTEKWENENF